MLQFSLLSALILAALAMPASAQTEPLPVDIRCYTSPPGGGPGALTLPDLTFQRSNVLRRYVCPACGYGSSVRGAADEDSGYCPNPWALPGHPPQSSRDAGTRLTDWSPAKRVLDVPPWEMGAAHQADLQWYDWEAGGVSYRALVGLPFHPQTETAPGSGMHYGDGDPLGRGRGRQVYVRATLVIPAGGLDIDGDGLVDINPDAHFCLAFAPPPGASDPWPPDFTTGDGLAPWPSPPYPPGTLVSPNLGPVVSNVVDGSGTAFALPSNARGVWRVFLGWDNTAPWGDTWQFEGSNGGYLSATFVVSRLQAPPTGDHWTHGPGGPAELPNSLLPRVLVGPQVGATPARDDLYPPGATTNQRRFNLINRGQSALEQVRFALFESILAPPGLRAAGRPSMRPNIPRSAVQMGTSLPGAGALAGGAVDPRSWVQIALPTYQPASEPGDTLDHDPAANWGYRGLTLAYNDADGNARWDVSNLSDDAMDRDDRVEEYSVFDLQVSVSREARLMASGGVAEPGRVSPGVPAGAPDTTVAAAGLPPGRVPFGSGVALPDQFAVSNESNVVTAPVLLGLNQALAAPISASPSWRSSARLTAANPVMLPVAPYTTLAASLAPGLGGAAAGHLALGRAGAGTPATPVPLGQSLGNYTGAVIYFLDLNNSGQLDFISGLTGMATSTATTVFDPLRDEPLEPVAFLPTSLRVTEGRLPFNDYYAADANPELRFDYGPGGVENVQVLWVSNRASVATGGGDVNQPAPPGMNPLTGTAQPRYPGNILYANAAPVVLGSYRNYVWSTPEAYNVTGTTAAASPGSVNASPSSYGDGTGTRWLFWHRSLRHAGGVESTLRWAASGGAGWPGVGGPPPQDSYGLYSTGTVKQGIRGFPDPNNPGQHWLFWAEGAEGRRSLHYRWGFTGTAADNPADEAPVPVSNQVSRALPRDTVPDFASGVLLRKPSASPFVSTRDPSALLWHDPRGAGGVGPQAHVFFSGYLARRASEDICWVAFDQANMNNPAANWGKLPFPRVVQNPVLPPTSGGPPFSRAGEQLEGDALRQVFESRHLDWLVSAEYPAASVAGLDPRLYIGLIYAASPGIPDLYAVNLASADYSRARGRYRALPQLVPIAGAPDLPGAGALHDGGILINPLGGGNQVLMELDPASGRISFSASLFNAANPSDPGAVFNRGVPGLGGLINVVLYADYTPFVFRVTTSDAADDSPTATLETDPADPYQRRLVLVWRRNYTLKDPPHFGRTSFLYKTWTLGVQVARPAITGGPGVGAWTGGGFAGLAQNTDYTVNPGSGIITLAADGYLPGGDDTGVFWLRSPFDGARLRVQYDDNNGVTRVEEHRVIGWSQDTPIPVDTVVNEGPVRAAHEIFGVPSGAGATLAVHRYWLAWSSPRPVYDLRSPGAAGSVVQQSSDVYLATFVPEYGTLREAEAEWQSVY